MAVTERGCGSQDTNMRRRDLMIRLHMINKISVLFYHVSERMNFGQEGIVGPMESNGRSAPQIYLL